MKLIGSWQDDPVTEKTFEEMRSKEQSAIDSARQCALSAFESMRRQAATSIDHEPSLDEINAMIVEVRKSRCERN